uniref:TLC domain-containing protein n=1 Tax=Haptolina brevifila TaxID=156173 RepID=A0A7S2NSB1_9EUKA|mmetsp:Transcript_8849/g.17985  ORF Transcript_8849/g.17985 Transcript_8849/m.17985 type:complete len:317 (+) Transcript_8849:137-1087(+)|eukprot:CAMPEP_0174726398 /NCGR_PEP_ID=MMETSP1094-20130205/47752_1 /TAXON_ID=156173 /ORGANISM="Chrysochromulina brevifilum, Strain UTEX LB 985" /LENGTH=316 /DNA_ID=CAMNT_0015927977 /DNA_START=137 /DNA_END=1087 /DNA_ORIENTATION=-
MTSSSFSFHVDMSWENSWPFYTVYPCSFLFFLFAYFLGPRFWPKFPFGVGKQYEKMSEMNKMCWQQNFNGMIHAVTCTLLLIVAIAIDPVLIDERPLHMHYNIVGYAALSLSIGYFSFAIPWTNYLYFRKHERHATNMSLVIHHHVVWLACLSYILGRTCGLYGAVAFACMEFTNWFFVAGILLQQMRSKRRKLMGACNALLYFSFFVCRVVICTYMMVLFSIDLSSFSSDSAGETFLVIFQYAIFIFVWALSFYFAIREVKPLIKQKLAQKVDKRREQRKKVVKGSIAEASTSTASVGSDVSVTVKSGLQTSNNV